MHRSIFFLLLFTVCVWPLWAHRIIAQKPVPPDFPASIQAAALRGDRASVAALCRDWYATGACSPGVLNWNYNALIGLEPSSLLITQNENDTYPAWVLQYALNVRPDVFILNLQLFDTQAYKSFFPTDAPPVSAGNSREELLYNILNNQADRPTYLGVMLDKNLLEANNQHLYLTGLTFKYSLRGFDNVAVLRHNYEHLFFTDYLRQRLLVEQNPSTMAALNLNYIPAFLLLYQHYTAIGELGKATDLQDVILQIARAGDREATVRAFFSPEKKDSNFISEVPVKKFEKGLKKAGGKMWAAETETTNGQYALFLQDLLQNRDFEQIAICKTTQTNWRALLSAEQQTLPDAVVFEHNHPDAPNMPVQNISYDAAQRYCAWMTKVYNAATEKKKYKKVLFRLPTEAEWQVAAAGSKGGPYPWGGPYVRNSKGCYLANIHATKPCGDCPQKNSLADDGGFFPVQADSYYPNDFGLYNMCGNIAEMVQESGKAKGGSWEDLDSQCQINSIKLYTAPSPAIGFRVFMEVIEE